MSEFATREEVNGLGERLNSVAFTVSSHSEAINTIKQDGRDLWNAIGAGREEDKRIERMVNAIAVKVAGIATIATIIQALIVWQLTKGAG